MRLGIAPTFAVQRPLSLRTLNIPRRRGSSDPIVTTHGTYSTGSASTTASVTVTNGTIRQGETVILVCVANSNRTLTTPSDPSLDTWTSLLNYTDTTNRISAYYKVASADMIAGTVVTASINASASKGCQLFSISGLHPTTPVSVIGTGATGASTAPVASLSGYNSNDIVLSILGILTGTADAAVVHDAGFTPLTSNDTGSVYRIATAYKQAGGATSVTKTDTLGTSRTWVDILFSLKRP